MALTLPEGCSEVPIMPKKDTLKLLKLTNDFGEEIDWLLRIDVAKAMVQNLQMHGPELTLMDTLAGVVFHGSWDYWNIDISSPG